uniref:Uncharacterized protein n=1 Tax=Myotis myotis TaxID=51298 RepID=A0A7J7VYX4_MYOMY|nr:hypothetical protein mMyoMyo1_012300 [Myotis myotis]
MISKGPSGLRRAGFAGSPPHPPSSISLGVRLLCPGATAEGSGPSSLHEQVFQKWTARGRVSGRLTAKGLSLFFGKALWPALETALHGVEEGRSQRVEEAEAGKGSPQLEPFSPRPPAAIHGAPGGVQGGVWWEQEPGQSLCQPWTPPPGLLRAPSPSVPQKRERPNH